jgi:hypothetical protein
MTRAYHHWTMGDTKLLREHYPAGGTRACLLAMPHLTYNQVRNQAHKQGIKFNGAAKAA